MLSFFKTTPLKDHCPDELYQYLNSKNLLDCKPQDFLQEGSGVLTKDAVKTIQLIIGFPATEKKENEGSILETTSDRKSDHIILKITVKSIEGKVVEEEMSRSYFFQNKNFIKCLDLTNGTTSSEDLAFYGSTERVVEHLQYQIGNLEPAQQPQNNGCCIM